MQISCGFQLHVTMTLSHGTITIRELDNIRNTTHRKYAKNTHRCIYPYPTDRVIEGSGMEMELERGGFTSNTSKNEGRVKRGESHSEFT